MILEHDMTGKGWKLIEDNSSPELPVLQRVLLADLMHKRNAAVSGEEMRRHAQHIGANLGQRHAEYLARHQEIIPECLHVAGILFPGTRWRDEKGKIQIPVLRGNQNQDGGIEWKFGFTLLDEEYSQDEIPGYLLLQPVS